MARTARPLVNGEPVTAEDVKFSFDRYKGASAKLLKDRVKEVQVLDVWQPRAVRSSGARTRSGIRGTRDSGGTRLPSWPLA